LCRFKEIRDINHYLQFHVAKSKLTVLFTYKTISYYGSNDGAYLVIVNFNNVMKTN